MDIQNEDNSQVEYRAIPGLLGYHAGSDGSIWSQRPPNGKGPLKTVWKQKKPWIDPSGYARISFSNPIKYRFVHRLVLESFTGQCPPGMEACHNDGNRQNNTLSNLRWDTKKSNQLDRVLHRTSNRCERNGRTKLTKNQVLEIRSLYDSKSMTQAKLAEKYGVIQAQISNIVRLKSWKNV